VAKIQLIATAAFGLEAVAAREVQALGYTDVMVENGRVTFAGDLEAICRANLWLRSADRVLVRMGEFQTLSFEELFQQTRALPWADWLPENAAFPVDGKSVRSQLHSVPDCQAIVKKAIVEKMKERYRRDWFEENGPRYTVEAALLKDMATLTIDTTGAGLHNLLAISILSDSPGESFLPDPSVRKSLNLFHQVFSSAYYFPFPFAEILGVMVHMSLPSWHLHLFPPRLYIWILESSGIRFWR